MYVCECRDVYMHSLLAICVCTLQDMYAIFIERDLELVMPFYLFHGRGGDGHVKKKQTASRESWSLKFGEITYFEFF